MREEGRSEAKARTVMLTDVPPHFARTPLAHPHLSLPGGGMNYLFLKKFHVSPFHNMDYVYDWDFSLPGEDTIRVATRMRGKGGEVEFVAKFRLKRRRWGGVGIVRELVR